MASFASVMASVRDLEYLGVSYSIPCLKRYVGVQHTNSLAGIAKNSVTLIIIDIRGA